jgi:hypothetical protein
MTNDLDDFMGGGGSSVPAFKFDHIGATVSGQILDGTKLEDRRPDGTAVTWDDGSPKHVWVFQLDTTGDGLADTSVWVRGNMVKVLKEAMAEAGLKPSDKPKITLKHHELGEARKGYAAPKLYKAKVEPAPAPAAAIDDF